MAELTYEELGKAFGDLGLQEVPVLAHASLHAFGRVQGGPDTVLSALLPSVGALMMPTHTYETMITPMVGPANNAIVYGRRQDTNRMANFYNPGMPADRLMGILPETLRQRPEAKRSNHPILSFAGINMDNILQTQTLEEPLAPIGALAEKGGWILLIGVDHSSNTSIHYAEKLVGRKQFVRWALTLDGIVACPGFPGCSAGFQSITSDVAKITRLYQIGNAVLQAMPVDGLLEAVKARLKRNPKDLLCSDLSCERCNEIRNQ